MKPPKTEAMVLVQVQSGNRGTGSEMQLAMRPLRLAGTERIQGWKSELLEFVGPVFQVPAFLKTLEVEFK